MRYDSFLQISELLLSESCLHLVLTMISTFRENERVTEVINYLAALESITVRIVSKIDFSEDGFAEVAY